MKEAAVYRLMLLGAFLFRLVLAVFPGRANDEHDEVVSILQAAYRAGSSAIANTPCKECYHPKLYHYLCLVAGEGFHLSDAEIRVAGQLINAAFGMACLYCLVVFIRRTRFPSFWKYAAVALACFNPSFVAINVQMTNDSLAITFGVLVTFWTVRFIDRKRLSSAVFLSFGTLLALLTKHNGVVLFAWVLLVLFFSFVLIRKGYWRAQAVKGLTLFVLITVAGIVMAPKPLSTYSEYFRRVSESGSISAFNFKPAPLPALFEEKHAPGRRPGVLSIYRTYFTFPLIDMLKTPYITQAGLPIPFHRTSLWAQLYGRFHFSFFENWVWRWRGGAALHLGRLLLIAGLLPSFLILPGIISITRGSGGFGPSGFAEKAMAAQVTAFLAAIVSFSLSHGDYCAMKDIYMLPAVLSFLYCFMRGGCWLDQALAPFERARLACHLLVLCLPAFYVLNLTLMIGSASRWF